jgi:hypothetical protein
MNLPRPGKYIPTYLVEGVMRGKKGKGVIIEGKQIAHLPEWDIGEIVGG